MQVAHLDAVYSLLHINTVWLLGCIGISYLEARGVSQYLAFLTTHVPSVYHIGLELTRSGF